MHDPRKPVQSPAPEQSNAVLDGVHRILLASTEVGAKNLGMTGCSFVVIGMGVWTAELTELDGRATAKYLRALADIFDPRTNDNQKRRAEKDRSQAVRDLYAALDLEMAETKGHA